MAAPCSKVQLSGIRARVRWSVTASGPNDPGITPNTRSPGTSSVTSSPTSTTTPAASPPRLAAPGYMPSPISTSRKFRPAARTATRTCPGSSGAVASALGSNARLSRVPAPVESRCHAGSETGGSSAPVVPARARRGVRIRPARSAICDSPEAMAAATAATKSSGPTAAESETGAESESDPEPEGTGAATGSRSKSRPRSRSSSSNRSGCSDWAERTRPHTGARARSRTSSPCSVATAPRVTTTSRESAKRSCASHSWTVFSAASVVASTARAVPCRSPASPFGAHTTTEGASSGAPVSARESARSATVVARSGRRAPSPRWSSPSNAQRVVDVPSPVSPAAGSAARRGVQSMPNSASFSGALSVATCAAAIARSANDSTRATGWPAESTASMDTASGPAGAIRTRSAVAPEARSDTPVHANGRRAPSSAASGPKPLAWRAASNSAGCRPKRTASAFRSSGRATSAKTSSPRRQAARRPWKAGPYPYPAPAIAG